MGQAPRNQQVCLAVASDESLRGSWAVSLGGAVSGCVRNPRGPA